MIDPGDPRIELLSNFIQFAHAIGYTGLLDELHGDAYRTLRSHRVSGFVIPRGEYKTTAIAEAGVLYEHTTNIFRENRGRERVMLVGATAGKALDSINSQVEKIRGDLHFTDGARCKFTEAFPWMSVTRSKVDLGYNVRNRRGPNKDFSTYGVGIDGAQAGYHPTLIVNDDLVNEQSSDSPTTLEKIIDRWYKQEQLAENPATARRWNIWTPWVPGDLHEHVTRRGAIPMVIRPFWSGRPREEDMPGEFREQYVDHEKGWTGWPLAPEIKNASYYEACCDPESQHYIPESQRTTFLDCEIVTQGRRVYEERLIRLVRDRGEMISVAGVLQLPGDTVCLVDPGVVGKPESDPSGISVWHCVQATNLLPRLEALFPPGILPSKERKIWFLVHAQTLPGGQDTLYLGLPSILKDHAPSAASVFLENAGQQQMFRRILQQSVGNSITVAMSPRITGDRGKRIRAGHFVTCLREGLAQIPHDAQGAELAIDSISRYHPMKNRDDLHDSMTIQTLFGPHGPPIQEPPDEIEPGSLAAQQFMEEFVTRASKNRWRS